MGNTTAWVTEAPRPALASDYLRLTVRAAPSSVAEERGPDAEPAVIFFYEKDEPFYEFTNFAPFPVNIDGVTWPTSEHYFQAQKFTGRPDLQKYIRHIREPRDAFNAARQYAADVRSDWHRGAKDRVMRMAVRAKFSQHPELGRLLLSTKDAVLVEHTTNDAYWGDGGGAGLGENMLGQILMEVRRELREGLSASAAAQVE